MSVNIDNLTARQREADKTVALDATSAHNVSLVLNDADTATTVGAAGGATALPATPTGYIFVSVAGKVQKIPFYAP
jgi:hypothetical protein